MKYTNKEMSMPPDKPLGEPKRRFADTFDAIKLIIEHFKLETEKTKTK